MEAAVEERVETRLPRVYVNEPGQRVPLKVWARDLEGDALSQATDLARLPFAAHHVALMPDAHPGYGMPIGGVLFAEAAVIPYAVGVDIGCGVALLNVAETVENLTPAKTQALVDAIALRVPVGNGPQAEHDVSRVVDIDLGRASVQGLRAISEASRQLGTLGGGNHFIELQRDDEGALYVMLHSGSRSAGKKICDYWHKKAVDLTKRWHSKLPTERLAFLPWGTPEALAYYNDMMTAMEWAEANRRAMLGEVKIAVGEVLGVESDLVVDVHHNYASFETHFGRTGIVHRKGAVRARDTDMVLIPGSMGTASYVGQGLGNVDSFSSCQHGAGRARSRAATLKLETQAEFLASIGDVKLGGKAIHARDESPFAYKDIESVMADSTDLVRPVTRLTPLGVVKG